MPVVDRIVILGRSGSGKSTLARRIGRALDLPVVHLDALWWRPGWVDGDLDAFREVVAAAAGAERWVMEGNYSRTFDLRLPRAQRVIMLDPPRWLCLWRVASRTARHWGRTRPDLAPDCPERFDPTFFRYVWRWDHDVRPRLWLRLAEEIDPAAVVRLGSRREVSAFLRALTPGDPERSRRAPLTAP